MPLPEILRNSAPAIGGLLVAAIGLAFTKFSRRPVRRGPTENSTAPHAAE